MRKYGSLVQQIETTLTDLGPMTSAEICQELGLEKGDLSSIISRMCRTHKQHPKRLYVSGYTFEHETHGRRYPRAIYALGDLSDKPKPKTSRQEIVRRYNANKHKRLTANSVFNLGLPRRILREQSRSQQNT